MELKTKYDVHDLVSYYKDVTTEIFKNEAITKRIEYYSKIRAITFYDNRVFYIVDKGIEIEENDILARYRFDGQQ